MKKATIQDLKDALDALSNDDKERLEKRLNELKDHGRSVTHSTANLTFYAISEALRAHWAKEGQ